MGITQAHLFHVQQVCKVTLNGKERSVGILEHAAFDPHDPSGFKEFGDTWKPG